MVAYKNSKNVPIKVAKILKRIPKGKSNLFLGDYVTSTKNTI
jgi:hypothetical protein